MSQQFHYANVSEAIEKLRLQGFVLDFEVHESGLKIGDSVFAPEELEISDMYRYEGESDPADESTVFALKVSNAGLKGIFVTGYGPNATDYAEDIIRKLQYGLRNR